MRFYSPTKNPIIEFQTKSKYEKDCHHDQCELEIIDGVFRDVSPFRTCVKFVNDLKVVNCKNEKSVQKALEDNLPAFELGNFFQDA